MPFRPYYRNFSLRIVLRTILSASFLLYIAGRSGRIKIVGSSSFGARYFKPEGDALRSIYQFPEDTAISGLAPRHNGKLLVTLSSAPEVWSIDPVTRDANLVFRFDGLASVVGIVETKHETFVVLTCDTIFDMFALTGSCDGLTAWTLYPTSSRGLAAPPTNLSTLWDSRCPSSMIYLPSPEAGHLLITDACTGSIFSMDVSTGIRIVVAQDALFGPRDNGAVPRGINGMAVRESLSDMPDRIGQGRPVIWQLYYTNAFGYPFLGSIQLRANGSVSGPAQALVLEAPGSVETSDIALDGGGNVWISSSAPNALFVVDIETHSITNAVKRWPVGSINGIGGFTFGRTKSDRETLYMTTGRITDSIKGSHPPSMIMALDTKLLFDK